MCDCNNCLDTSLITLPTGPTGPTGDTGPAGEDTIYDDILRYKASITQSLTAAPVENAVFENTLVGTWDYISVGTYKFTPSTVGFFDAAKTYYNFQGNSTIGSTLSVDNLGYLRLKTFNSAGALANTQYIDIHVLIEVYP